MSQVVVNPYRYVVKEIIEQCTGFNVSGLDFGTAAIRTSKIQASSNLTITSLSCQCLYALGTVTIGIYSDNSGEPDALLAQTITASAVVGLHAYTLASTVNVTSGTDYWIAVFLTETAGLMSKTGSSGVMKQTPHFSTTLPDPFGSVTNTIYGLQVCFTGS